jgi:hypothetical protein
MKGPRALALTLALGVAISLVAAAPVCAGDDVLWGEGRSFLDPVPVAAIGASPLDGLDLSVVRDGTERTLRVPLAPREDAARAVLRPYLSVGSSFLVDGDAREAATLYEDNVRAQRKSMDVGAGLAWRLSKRVELFGEYRFLRMNPDPSEAASGVLHRDVDGPFLKGGFSIRLP